MEAGSQAPILSQLQRATSINYLAGRKPTKKTKPAGRVCADPSCAVRLSIYNHGMFCTVHEHQEAK